MAAKPKEHPTILSDPALTGQTLLDQVLALIHAKWSTPQSEMISEFASRFYQSMSEEDLYQRSAQDLYGTVLSLWDFLQDRKPGQEKLRIMNPDLEQHGWKSHHSVIELIHDEVPFLVDSVRMALNRAGVTLHLIIHFPIYLERDKRTHKPEKLRPITSVNKSDKTGVESILWIEIDRQVDETAIQALTDKISQVLKDVRLVVSDWQPMCQRLDGIIDELTQSPPPHIASEELQESLAFLQWIAQGHFTLMGFRAYDFFNEQGDYVLDPVKDSGLGLMRKTEKQKQARHLSTLNKGAQQMALDDSQVLILTKTNNVSPVHRPAHIDYIGIRKFNKQGKGIGEYRFIGLYTSSAYNLSPNHIPLLRRKIDSVIKNSELMPGSHDSKTLLNILYNYPRDELFQISPEELLRISLGILHIQERQVFRIFVRRDPYGRFFSCLVYVPRERYNTRLRIRTQQLLAKVFGSTEEIEFTTWFSESVLARTLYTVRVKNADVISYDTRTLEEGLVEISRSWDDLLGQALSEEFGEALSTKLAAYYVDAFPPAYTSETTVEAAVLDIKHMQALTPQEPLGMMLYRLQEDGHDTLRFKLFHHQEVLSLSKVMPILENLGLQVGHVRPFEITPRRGEKIGILDFMMTHAHGLSFELEEVKQIFHDAFAHVWRLKAENDGFNKLVLGAQLSWRDVSVLRAYSRYMRQMGFPFSLTYVHVCLGRYPDIARLLIELFYAKFDPDKKDRQLQDIRVAIKSSFEKIVSLDEDRIVRRYVELIEATLRTNYFQYDSEGHPKGYVSFKLDPSQIPEMPLPLPKYEIFLYSPRVEGVHLRAGNIARGGLRWSDRREDYRGEVLGLVKAQQVKNSVIVPMGAKGGFVCRMLPPHGSREEIQKEGIACYQIFIKGLLDVTDNIKEGIVIPPERVVRYDIDDPYLVVAADKGTATFSDIANRISEEYQFWLGDAFASGGSAGYDHKKIGITARAAWESVKRHFREMNIDTQTTDFTAIGVGDMAGDVFGNGMLMSKHIRLLAAFNHMHIFLDPNPEAEKSYAERERLFHLSSSTWADYDALLISQGGGIFSRFAKTIDLSPEVQKMLDVKESSLSPNELISAILRMKCDLLWNGGIGTYVKASRERHADVGDRTNDDVRVNGQELRCRVVGEGGNLGFTQLGRIEYALHGGHIHTDFTDNVGGVNCSDNEVNIKILLNHLVAQGDMTLKQRNELLLHMTEHVADIVIANNYHQVQSLSVTESRALLMMKELNRFIHALERGHKLNRALEFLPTDEEIIERKSQGRGLTRPELAVLLAYGKMALKTELNVKEITQNQYFASVLEHYFPEPLRVYERAMNTHRLRGEIIATQLANHIVNTMGCNFVHRMQDETGTAAPEVAICYTIAENVFDIESLYAAIEALDHKVDVSVQTAMIFQTQRMLRRATRWFLRHRDKMTDMAHSIEYFKPGIAELYTQLPNVLDRKENTAIAAVAKEYTRSGVPPVLAHRVAYLSTMFAVLDIVEISKAVDAPIQLVAGVYYKLGAELELHWFLEQIVQQSVDNHWQALARSSFREDVDWQQRLLTLVVLRTAGQEKTAEAKIRVWLEMSDHLLARWRQTVADFRTGVSHEFAMFSVVLRELALLVQNCEKQLNK